MQICIVGLGYIGLPTAAVLANSGHEVLGVDNNEKVIATLQQGEIHIEEPGLLDFVSSSIERSLLRVSTQPELADAFIIAVPTPITKDYKADLSYVISATRSILPFIRSGNIVIVESTIPPRTVEDIVCPILIETGLILGEELFVAHCPERVLPGKIIHELEHNNRIVGGINKRSSEKASEVYKSFVKGDIYLTDATTAEMAKLMENTFRDVNIALANELALISEELNINALEVIQLANKHPRVNIHSPGPGVGGHCIAVDPYFIVEKSPEKANMISLARKINNSMPHFVVEQIKHICGSIPDKVAVLGITYKGNVDDIRESPALEVIELLKHINVKVGIFDPHVDKSQYPVADSLEQALENAGCAVILADHNEFKNLDYKKFSELMNVPILFDTKNCLKESDSVTIYKLGNYKKATIQLQKI